MSSPRIQIVLEKVRQTSCKGHRETKLFFPPKVLQRLRGPRSDIIEDEILLMQTEAANQTEKRSLWSVLRDPTLFLPVVLVCALQGGQQLSGINAVSLVYVFKTLIYCFLAFNVGGPHRKIPVSIINIFPSGILLLRFDFRIGWTERQQRSMGKFRCWLHKSLYCFL